jgi:signal transduction histidine kinase
MTTIRFCHFFIIFISLSVTIGFGVLTGLSFHQETQLLNDLETSYELEQTVGRLLNKKFETKTYEGLRSERRHLQPQARMEGLSNVIEAYAEKSPRLIKLQVETFQRNEKQYRDYVRPLISYLRERQQYYASISLLAMVLGLLINWMYLNANIFGPIHGLARRMMEFLEHRYTYQFTQPAPNEIGHLQSTFNAMAQRVLQNMEELSALDKAKSEFLSIASHELRTPLTSIKGSLSLMRSGIAGILNETTNNLLSIAETETDRLIRLINDILDLAKIEARRFPLHPKWQPLHTLFHGTTESLHGLASQADVRLNAYSEIPMEVYMDTDRIQQVLTNLISNAVKFSPRGSSVEIVSSVKDDGSVLIEVRDQGRGIAPADQELLFQKFRQVTNQEQPLVKGTGLGLAIAKALVEEHGGTIGVRSTVGRGSTFYFTLPKWRHILEEVKVEVRAA